MEVLGRDGEALPARLFEPSMALGEGAHRARRCFHLFLAHTASRRIIEQFGVSCGHGAPRAKERTDRDAATYLLALERAREGSFDMTVQALNCPVASRPGS